MALADPDLLVEFLTEAGDLLEDVDRKLIALEQRPDDAALLNAVFRGFHTIKGGAGFLDAGALVELCHRTEGLLGELRDGRQRLTAGLLDVILLATAAVRTMFDELAARGKALPAVPALLDALTRCAQGHAPGAVAAIGAAPVASGEPDWDAFHAAITGLVASRPGTGPAQGSRAVVVKSPARENTLRIDVGRFDRILNLSGELGLTRNRLVRLKGDLLAGDSQPHTLKELDQVVNALSTLVGDLQDTVMQARMQPVGRVFQKYTRLARDLARQLGKDIELAIEGEDTEIDKTMLEALNDPIVHLVRNAVDHGVELPDERAAIGKPARATVRLSARQVGDTIVITIDDDGRGMDADALRRKAIDKALIAADAAKALDDRGALELIFLPGFTTRHETSGVSGRGVGMDVARSNVLRLSGRIEVASVFGRGTTITITLPLTLAILPVLMFRLQHQPYAIPLASVREIMRIAPDAVQQVAGRPSLTMRGEVMPLVDLAPLLGRERDAGGIGIVAHVGSQSMILVADSFVGQDEVVIKALEGFKPRGVAGATLASDGTLVLVLDLPELLTGAQARACGLTPSHC